MSIPSTPTQEANGTASSGNTVTVTIATPSVGATLFYFYLAPSAQPAVSSIAAVGSGGTWTLESAHTVMNARLECWRGTVGTSPGTSVVSTQTGTISAAVRGYVAEFPGTFTRDTRIDTNNSGSVNPADSGTFTPTGGVNFVAFSMIRRAGTFSSGPTNGYVAGNTGSGTQRVDYLVVGSASGSYSTQWTFATALPYDSTTVAFSQAGGATVFPPPFRLFQSVVR